MREKYFSILNLIPLVLFFAYILIFVLSIPQSDITMSFIPAGNLMLNGQSPYIINETRPFIYWPPALWVFLPFALVPFAHQIFTVINVILLVLTLRRLELSSWWYIYPPVLYSIAAGQLDILVLWLSVEAYVRRLQNSSIIIIFLAILLKPQTALFWTLPWFFGQPNYRRRLRSICVGLITIILLLSVWFLASPAPFSELWTGWLNGIRQHSSAYTGDSPSFWAVEAPLLALTMLVLWLVAGKYLNVSRAFLALGLPAMRYYSMITLVGIVPVQFALIISYLVVVLAVISKQPNFWLEPVIYSVIIVLSARRSLFNFLGMFATSQ